MRTLLTLGLLLLSGCTHAPPETDISGVWINQSIIDAAAVGQPLNLQGTNLEWNIDTRAAKAQVSNGFERGDGQLLQKSPGAWTVDYDGYATDELRFDGKQLTQLAKASHAQQVFSRTTDTTTTGDRWSNTFRRALNSAYMGGKWNIVEGPGSGSTVVFSADGRVSGLANTDGYELCLDGDCSSQGAGNKTLRLSNEGIGTTWIFVRNGKQMDIRRAINLSSPNEVPQLAPGPREWLLEKQ